MIRNNLNIARGWAVEEEEARKRFQTKTGSLRMGSVVGGRQLSSSS